MLIELSTVFLKYFYFMLIIPIKPIPKPRMTRSDKWKKRKCTTEYWKYKDELAKYDIDLSSGILNIIFFLKMPDSWSKKKKRENNLKPHNQTPDLDNLIKSVLDCVLNQDNFIYRIKAEKLWSTKNLIVIR